jgi:hypothetical protein
MRKRNAPVTRYDIRRRNRQFPAFVAVDRWKGFVIRAKG